MWECICSRNTVLSLDDKNTNPNTNKKRTQPVRFWLLPERNASDKQIAPKKKHLSCWISDITGQIIKMVISKKGNFNQSTSSPKEKPQEGEWRSQEIWLCRFRQITLLCVPVPFSFYLTRLCPSPVSLSRQRHSSSCPVFSFKRAAGGKDRQSKVPSPWALHRATNRIQMPRNE